MSGHPEKVGHCAACAEQLAELTERMARAEKLIEQLDDVLSQIVRETPVSPSDSRPCPHGRPGAWLCPHCHPVEEESQNEPTWTVAAVPAALPTEETVPERRKA